MRILSTLFLVLGTTALTIAACQKKPEAAAASAGTASPGANAAGQTPPDTIAVAAETAQPPGDPRPMPTMSDGRAPQDGPPPFAPPPQ